MKKDVLKMVALAIAGAIIPVYAYLCGTEKEENTNFISENQNEAHNPIEDEDVAIDTR